MTDGKGNVTQHSDWDERREQLSAYVDGEVPEAERATLEAHLATCADCRRELAELRQVRALLRAVPAPTLPRSFALPVEETAGAPAVVPIARRTAMTAARTTSRVNRRARATQWAGGLAASVGLLLLLGSALATGGIRSFGGASTSGSSSLPASARTTNAPAGAGANAPTHAPQTGVQDHATPSEQGLGQSTPTTAPSATSSGPERTPFNREIGSASIPTSTVVGITGAGLAGGGALLFIGGSVARRRKRNQ